MRLGSPGAACGAAAACGSVRGMALGREPLFSVVYHSSETPGQGSIDRSELLAHARAKNRVIGVTGMLLAENGRFVQELEGPESVVRELMATIAADPRHEHVRILLEEPIAARRFPDWAMAEGHLTELETLQPVEYTEAIVAARDALPDPPSRVERVLNWFRSRPVVPVE